MAELHILGHIQSVAHFKDPYSLFCRYSFQAGPNWTLVSGCSEGQTLTGRPDYNNVIFWSHPIDVHYVSKGIQGWPKLIFHVSCLDSIGRSWIVGYGACSLPATPGLHKILVPCWAPVATTLLDRLKQSFLGGSHQLSQIDIVSFGSDRFKINTESKGDIELSVNIILRNFSQFGVEYK